MSLGEGADELMVLVEVAEQLEADVEALEHADPTGDVDLLLVLLEHPRVVLAEALHVLEQLAQLVALEQSLPLQSPRLEVLPTVRKLLAELDELVLPYSEQQ